MSPAAIYAAAAFVVGTVFAAVVQSAIGTWQKRQDEHRRDTGRRIGKVESWMDFQRGYQAGLRAAERKHRGSNDR